jgi:hypothetical protein
VLHHSLAYVYFEDEPGRRAAAREWSSPFHGGNTGSIPVGRANDFNDLIQLQEGESIAYGKNTA